MKAPPIIDTWVFPGAGNTSEWPRWVVFLNYACDAEKIVIHQGLSGGRIIAHRGDTLQINSVREISVLRAQES